MSRPFAIGISLVYFLLPVLAQVPSGWKQTFPEILEMLVVRRNGEVVLDVRSSSPERWQRELLDRTAPWRMDKVSSNVFRYIVIHEYNRYHSVQLDREQRVLSVFTTHVEEAPLVSSGPGWNRPK
jgi:hypothetical protein